MRKHFSFKTVATLFAVLMCLVGAYVSFGYSKGAKGVQIVIRHRPGTQGNAPRSNVDNPFYAELTQFGVLLSADSDWGNATVTLSSLEGDYYQTIFDMADGSILLPISGATGDSYSLLIIIGGLEFEGEFML